MALRDRHLWGAGAGACAICCAPPVLALLGIAGAGVTATLATLTFAGIVAAVVVGLISLAAVISRSRRDKAAAACDPDAGPVEVSISRSESVDAPR